MARRLCVGIAERYGRLRASGVRLQDSGFSHRFPEHPPGATSSEVPVRLGLRTL